MLSLDYKPSKSEKNKSVKIIHMSVKDCDKWSHVTQFWYTYRCWTQYHDTPITQISWKWFEQYGNEITLSLEPSCVGLYTSSLGADSSLDI